MMEWIKLHDIKQLESITEKSYKKPQVLFKHSVRCGVSSVVLRRIEKTDKIPDADYYFLDLIHFRRISDEISSKFHVNHESPQLLLIQNGECTYYESHLAITMEDLEEGIQ